MAVVVADMAVAVADMAVAVEDMEVAEVSVVAAMEEVILEDMVEAMEDMVVVTMDIKHTNYTSLNHLIHYFHTLCHAVCLIHSCVASAIFFIVTFLLFVAN